MKRLFGIIFLISALVWGGVSLFLDFKPAIISSFKTLDTISTNFALQYNQFVESTISAQVQTIGSPQVIILPHHELVAAKIADIYASLTIKPDRVVVIGPDHSNIARCPIVYPESVFHTYGGITTGFDKLSVFSDFSFVCPDDHPFVTEHSTGIHLPFVTHYFGDIPVLTMLLRPMQNYSELASLSSKLSALPNTLFIISVDFSHYQTVEQTNLRDQEMISYIHNRDLTTISSLSSDHLDSPGSLALGLMLVKDLGLTHTNLIYSGNSSEFPNPPLEQTSYFILGFDKSSPDDIELLFGGDIMLGRSVQQAIKKQSDDTWPFRHLASYTTKADLFVANLESPFHAPCPDVSGGFSFCADTRFTAGLKFAGLDVLTLANNHISNYGASGISTTLDTLQANNIATIGVSNIHLTTIKGTSMALVGFNDIGSNLEPISESSPEFVTKSLSTAATQADFVIATFHWGEEYQFSPNDRQKLLATAAVKAGADLVVGHHPHWVQQSALIDGVPVYYSLGNLVFDQMWSEETRIGALLRVVLRNGQIHNRHLVFTKIFDFGQPRFIAPVLHML